MAYIFLFFFYKTDPLNGDLKPRTGNIFALASRSASALSQPVVTVEDDDDSQQSEEGVKAPARRRRNRSMSEDDDSEDL